MPIKELDERAEEVLDFDLAELQALPLPACTQEDIAGLPDWYPLDQFLAPRLNKEATAVLCVGCGRTLWIPGIMGFLLGASFTWGLTHGEGHCSRCGYPTRLYHYDPSRSSEVSQLLGVFPLQYHPHQVARKV